MQPALSQQLLLPGGSVGELCLCLSAESSSQQPAGKGVIWRTE